MKVIGIIGTGVLSLLLGTAAPAYAQHEQHAQQKEHAQQQHAQASQPAQHEQHAQQAKQSAQHEQHAQQTKQSKPAQKQHAQQTKQAKPVQKQQAQQTKQSRPAQKQQAAQRGDHDRGRRIPAEHFRANFGREHRFQINRPVIVEGFPRFQYGGYWFGFFDPWPVGWYYTDDVYVDFIGGGYYLFNPRHPGIRLAIRVF